jgi:hypothetical protein
MKRKFALATIAVFAMLFSHAVFAAPPDLLGEWTGSGQAIYPDGQVIDFYITGNLETKEGSLLAGSFDFALTVAPDTTFVVYFTGHVSEDRQIKLLLIAEGSPFGTGIAEAEWKGNKIEGVVRDFSDMSTGYFVLERAR